MTATEKAARHMLDSGKSYTAAELAKEMRVNKSTAHNWFWIIKATPGKYEISANGKPLMIKVLSVSSGEASQNRNADAELREKSAQRLAMDFVYGRLSA